MDEYGWDCFFQLSAGCAGPRFRTVRITTTPFRRAAGHLCFDRTVGLSSPEELDGLAEIVDGERILDVQVVDALSVPTARGSRPVTFPRRPTGRLAGPGRPRSTRLGWPATPEAGLSVPAQIGGDVACGTRCSRRSACPVVAQGPHRARWRRRGHRHHAATDVEHVAGPGSPTGSTFVEQSVPTAATSGSPG